jgi:ABC-2 type transport system permease protein
MKDVTETIPTTTPARVGGPSYARIFALEAKYEFLKLARIPAYAVPTICFPAFFYVIFGLSFGAKGGGGEGARYLLATYAALGTVGAALFGFGIGVATERGQGWLLLKRATPMPPLAYFFAKLVMSLMFSGITVLLLTTLGVAFGGVRFEPAQWLALAGVILCGAIPFCALGLALGLLLGPNSAAPVVNLIYLPLAFASGLWMPVDMLPTIFQKIAPFLPAYHYSQLALGTIGMSRDAATAQHLVYLAVFTVVCVLVALRAYRAGSEKMYG